MLGPAAWSQVSLVAATSPGLETSLVSAGPTFLPQLLGGPAAPLLPLLEVLLVDLPGCGTPVVGGPDIDVGLLLRLLTEGAVTVVDEWPLLLVLPPIVMMKA